MDAVARAMEVSAQLTAPGAPFELTVREKRGQALPVYRHAPQSLAAVVEQARRDDDVCFMVYRQDRWSFKRFFAELDALCHWLHEAGVGPGSAVAIACRNRPEWVVAFCALARIGAVPAPLNSFGKQEELLAAINDIQPELLICDKDRLRRLSQPNPQADANGAVIKLPPLLLIGNQSQTEQACISPDASIPSVKNGGVTGHITEYGQVISSYLDQPPLPLPVCHTDDPALILFTSGATSRAKAVLSSQQAVCQALFNIDYISALSAMTSPDIVKNIMARACEPVILTAVPLFHVSGLHAQLLTALRTGRRLVFMHKWEPVQALETMRQERVTQFNGAPSMVMQLLREPAFFAPDILDNFSGLGFGGAGLPETLVELVLDKLPQQMVGIGFGMTETNGVGSAVSGDLFRGAPKSSGVISPLIEVQITNPIGEVMPVGQTGEVCLKGITVMDEYVGNPAATADTIRNGWLHTGDLGYLDDNRFLFIVDRLKDVINRAGENIAAAEVESCLLRHTAVREAAVFGVPDEETGEAVVAVVSVVSSAVDEQQLRDHVAGILAAYKVPSRIHILAQNLPRNPAGKLLRSQLKQTYSTDTATA
ncbi:long-chain-fatty-acid--CoA ligase [Shewanella sp. NFH-SH190041]|uniref:class I adenylate-forming enzyme family protein n=1 Tax=Shewanella sp. NFH-SH190041 TaxID=2950245 RepID=UPI0021C335BD|nr:class I adenylate-forming enzyme family protein [Shewanella sp. NFH-SH190041]BDM64409.1 long-chain-fatty-acid--CoA ligase [Shewanella sp. NFH-SH190041]